MEAKWQGSILDRFIVLEGLDGAGTTTQLGLLQEAVHRRGDHCVATGEPTGGPIGRVLREVLRGDLRMEPCTLALLFAADRSEHLHRQPDGILAQLRTGSIVASDRYLFSSLVYQSLECSPDYVTALNARFPLPRHLFFIDTPPELCQQRLAARRRQKPAPAQPEHALAPREHAPPQREPAPPHPELFDDPRHQRRLRDRYTEVLEQFTHYGVAVHTVDGSGDRATVFARIWRHLKTT